MTMNGTITDQGRQYFCLVCLGLLLAGCARGGAEATPFAPSPTTPASVTDTPVATDVPSRNLPGGLTWEEHELAGAPGLEPLSFMPVEGTQSEILSRHAGLRDQGFEDHSFFDGPNPAMWAPWEDGRIVARVLTSQTGEPRQTVEVVRGDRLIGSFDAGLPSPALPIQGLWTFDGLWVLEMLLSTPEEWTGQVFVDGTSLNDAGGYDETFSFQLLADRPFYLYRRDGKIGLNFDGQDADLGYDDVPHYRCCSESVVNPKHAQQLVAFFAQRAGTWYYVEIGAFGGD